MQNDENATGFKPAAAFPGLHTRKVFFLLCFLAAIHVFIFSVGFPFFNNVDERLHFDLVLKYSHGHVPRGLEPFTPEAAPYLAFFSSPAYRSTDPFFNGEILPPFWTEPVEKMRQDFEWRRVEALSLKNHEASQAPLYYAVAGIWWHIGQWIGLNEGRLLYWLRFFDIVEVVTVVWLAYAVARMVFPENSFIQLAVPALVAFMPQTAFYSVGNDALSPLCFGITFLCLLKWLSSKNPSALLGAATGLAFAATYLTKATNLPLLAVVGAALLFKTGQSFRRGEQRAVLSALLAFLGCAAPPILGWMMWCKSHFGDLTGSKFKAERFGWTVKPFGEWWHHPIFTPGGLWTYLSGQLATFWQGQFKWDNQPLVLPGTDFIYTVLSLVLLVAVLPVLLPRFSKATAWQRRVLLFSLVCFVAGLGFFALMSIIYDFHRCIMPSRQYPYFAFGRMLLGALIPFLLVIVCGLDYLLNRFGTMTKFIILASIISAMLLTEIATDWRVFSDPFNWFHLP